MYVNPFWFGVIVTVVAEVAIIFLVIPVLMAIFGGKKK